MRRTPRWVVEVTTWSAALVLLGGIAVAVTKPVEKKVVYDETPVVSVEPAKVTPPLPAKKPVANVKPKARTGVPVEQSLGPQPGPVPEQVPTAFAPPEQRYAFLVGVTDYRSPTHDTIAGAEFVSVEGMGHHFASALVEPLLERISAHLRAARPSPHV